MNRAIRRRAARQDLVDIIYHYIRAGSPATGRRFRQQVEATVQLLAGMPGMGARFEHEHPALAELRFLPVSRFKNYLVFYKAGRGRDRNRARAAWSAGHSPHDSGSIRHQCGC